MPCSTWGGLTCMHVAAMHCELEAQCIRESREKGAGREMRLRNARVVQECMHYECRLLVPMYICRGACGVHAGCMWGAMQECMHGCYAGVLCRSAVQGCMQGCM